MAVGKKGTREMTEEQQVKEWLAWYLQPPVTVSEVYGPALDFTEQEKHLTACLRKVQE
jgi:hypothetical protein